MARKEEVKIVVRQETVRVNGRDLPMTTKMVGVYVPERVTRHLEVDDSGAVSKRRR
jgi:hypothetical protein